MTDTTFGEVFRPSTEAEIVQALALVEQMATDVAELDQRIDALAEPTPLAAYMSPNDAPVVSIKAAPSYRARRAGGAL